MQYRQGDVFIEKIGDDAEHGVEIPRDAQGRIILAEGEATGHAHAIWGHATFFMDTGSGPGGILKAEKPVDVVHEEHTTINLGAGTYRVTRQREFDAGEYRYVAD